LHPRIAQRHVRHVGGGRQTAAVEDPRDFGRRGEAVALDWYVRSGFRLVARNWRCSVGELDLVLIRDGTLVFCEVKARRGTALGGPFEAVGPRKQHKLRLLGAAFLLQSELRPEKVRFDVSSVSVDGRGRLGMHVFEHAF
jgi:putative endonuclease